MTILGNKKCIKCGQEINGNYRFCQPCYDNIMSKYTRDYQDMTNKDTSKAVRNKLNIGDIRSNAIKCNKCGGIVRSVNRHHMAYCPCGAVAIDGGSWYSKISGNQEDRETIIERYNDVD